MSRERRTDSWTDQEGVEHTETIDEYGCKTKKESWRDEDGHILSREYYVDADDDSYGDIPREVVDNNDDDVSFGYAIKNFFSFLFSVGIIVGGTILLFSVLDNAKNRTKPSYNKNITTVPAKNPIHFLTQNAKNEKSRRVKKSKRGHNLSKKKKVKKTKKIPLDKSRIVPYSGTELLERMKDANNDNPVSCLKRLNRQDVDLVKGGYYEVFLNYIVDGCEPGYLGSHSANFRCVIYKYRKNGKIRKLFKNSGTCSFINEKTLFVRDLYFNGSDGGSRKYNGELRKYRLAHDQFQLIGRRKVKGVKFTIKAEDVRW